jgi:mevalonate kinase
MANESRLKLRIKDLPSAPDDTKRIIDMTRKTCDEFNAYYLDFFGSIEIITEQLESYKKAGKLAEADDAEGKIGYMKKRIAELEEFMRSVSEKMSEFVEIINANQA